MINGVERQHQMRKLGPHAATLSAAASNQPFGMCFDHVKMSISRSKRECYPLNQAQKYSLRDSNSRLSHNLKSNKAILVPKNEYKNDTLSHCVKGVLKYTQGSALQYITRIEKLSRTWPDVQ